MQGQKQEIFAFHNVCLTKEGTNFTHPLENTENTPRACDWRTQRRPATKLNRYHRVIQTAAMLDESLQSYKLGVSQVWAKLAAELTASGDSPVKHTLLRKPRDLRHMHICARKIRHSKACLVRYLQR